MTLNMRVLVGCAAILLVAVVFAQPCWAANATETWSTVVGLNPSHPGDGYDDMTTWLTNPSFETDKVTSDTYRWGSITGWTLLNGGNMATVLPGATGNNLLYGTPTSLATPLLPGGLGSPSCIPPVGYTVASDGSQVAVAYQTAFIQQTLHNTPNGTGQWSSAAHQTYTMTWEQGYMEPGNVGAGWGWSVGIVYGSNSWFMLINNDINFDTAHTDGHYADTVGNMYQYSWSFTTDTSSSYTGKTMAIRLGGGTNNNGSYCFFDNIHLYGPTGVVPEPSTVALLISGALGMLAYAWRRKRRK